MKDGITFLNTIKIKLLNYTEFLMFGYSLKKIKSLNHLVFKDFILSILSIYLNYYTYKKPKLHQREMNLV